MEDDILIGDWGSSKVTAEPVKRVSFAAVGNILGKLYKSELVPNVPNNDRASAIRVSSTKSRTLSPNCRGASPADTSGIPNKPLLANTSYSGNQSLDRGIPSAGTLSGPPPNVANPFKDNAVLSPADKKILPRESD